MKRYRSSFEPVTVYAKTLAGPRAMSRRKAPVRARAKLFGARPPRAALVLAAALTVLAATGMAIASATDRTAANEARDIRLDALAFRQQQWLAARDTVATPTAAAELRAVKLDANRRRIAAVVAGRTAPTPEEEMRVVKRAALYDRLHGGIAWDPAVVLAP